jgi:ubiquinol-cytochrome c reductase iron-sulfur subunit
MSFIKGKNLEYDKKEDKKDELVSSRRDFVILTASSVAGVGAIAAAVPFVRSLSPDASVLAVSTVEIDISNIKEGQTSVYKWQGKPVFVTRRTKKQIEEARSVKLIELKDPQLDEDRVKKGEDQWLVTVGVCTHLGCIPESNKGDYDGWFCPCHGSHYDISGRIRKGPAPKNLEIPPYEFLSDTKIKIG